MSLVREVKALLETLEYQTLIFCGHSLGGTAAFCLARQIPDSRSISYNMGAAATNPVYSGPGKERATVYHIFGDIIGTHISEQACTLYRVKLIGKLFGTLELHSSSTIYYQGPWKYATATEEDEAFLSWSTKGNYPLDHVRRFAEFFGLVKKSVNNNPIPGSYRYWHPDDKKYVRDHTPFNYSTIGLGFLNKKDKIT